MKSQFVICFLLLLGFQLPAAPTPSQSTAELRWWNGEMLSGKILGATPAQLRFQSPLFEDPLELDWKVLRRLDLPDQPSLPKDPFSFTARDGSFFYGNLISISKESVIVRSTRHGEIHLKPEQLLSIRRINRSSVAGQNLQSGAWYQGPQGGTAWTMPGLDSKTPPLLSPRFHGGPAGALLLPYWNTLSTYPADLPARFELQFTLSSTLRPDFQFTLLGKDKRSVSIETWDDELVMVSGDQFVNVRRLQPAELKLSLRLIWDQEANLATLFTIEGKKLTDIALLEPKANPSKVGTPVDQTLKAASQPPGFGLRNKGRQLVLESIILRNPANAPRESEPLQFPTIELCDGRTLSGVQPSLSDGSLNVYSVELSASESLPLDLLDALIFSTDEPTTPPESASLFYSDGTFLRGQIHSFQNDVLSLITTSCLEPIPATISGLRQLRTPPTAPTRAPNELPFEELDRIVINQTVMHGKLVPEQTPIPRWLPIGGLQPCTPSNNLPYKFTRFFKEGTIPAALPILIHTTNDDILSAELQSLDQKEIRFISPLFNRRQLPANLVACIQFHPKPVPNIENFLDGWQITKGSADNVQLSKDRLQMEPGTALWHPSAMACNQLKFFIEPSGFSTVSLKMFTTAAGENPIHLQILRNGSQLFLKLEGDANQQQLQLQLNDPDPAAISLNIEPKSISVSVNGIPFYTFEINTQPICRGLLLEPGGMWGNAPQSIILSKFSGKCEFGKLILPQIQTEAKKQALTVPRFRKESPPNHVLIAKNGDALRGSIEAATSTDLKFRTGLETFTIPQTRLSAAIWLKTPTPISEPDKPTLTRIKLSKPIADNQFFGNFQNFLALIRLAEPTVTFKEPAKLQSIPREFAYQNASIQGALDKACTNFGLQYLVDPEGSVLFSLANPTAPLMEIAFWLKEDRLKDTESMQAQLSKYGIDFPSGSRIFWDPNFKQLTASNTRQNLTKIGDYLQQQAGGILEQSSHQVLLNNGVRLALHAKSFTPESVSGSHPIYGNCTIPMRDVFEISNLAQVPSTIGTELRSWELLSAVEPVIPASGGEDTPLTGKPAPHFTLPLLNGSKFNLEDEKGSVVVLDFWATWCGPCVQSLPDLIQALAAFPEDKVKFIAINQGESADEIKRFLVKHPWNLKIALDGAQAVGKQYGAEAIPCTVIIGPDGNVVTTKVGYSADGAKELAAIIEKLLQPPISPKP